MATSASAFPTLLSPLSRGRLQLKNRVVFPGHQTLFSENGVIGPRMRNYYAERARGGVAAIVVEGAAVHDTTIKFPNYLLAHDPRIVRSLDELAAALHPHGCKGILQLAHSVTVRCCGCGACVWPVDGRLRTGASMWVTSAHRCRRSRPRKVAIASS